MAKDDKLELLQTRRVLQTFTRYAQGLATAIDFEYVKLDGLGLTPPKFVDTSAEGSGGILSFFRSALGSVCADAAAAPEEAAEDAAPVSEATLGLCKDVRGVASSKVGVYPGIGC